MWHQIRQILEMIRFSHSVFALPFALLAAVWAWTAPVPVGISLQVHWWQVLGLLVCIVAARSSAMAFNRIADIELDRRNPRTEKRHLPTQAISIRSAVVFTIASALLFVAGTVLFLPNALPLILSIPILIFLLVYSYMKRVTWLVHFWLGAALALAPIAAWIAIRGEVVLADPMDLVPVSILGLAVMFWVAGFDMIYACQDFQFDRMHGVHSVPAKFGIRRGLQIAAGCHTAMMILLIALPFCAEAWGPPLRLGFVYWLAVIGIASLLVYEHRLVRPDDLSRTQTAFFNVNAIISVGLFVAGTIDVFWL